VRIMLVNHDDDVGGGGNVANVCMCAWAICFINT
jgi:hypothetical protein